MRLEIEGRYDLVNTTKEILLYSVGNSGDSCGKLSPMETKEAQMQSVQLKCLRYKRPNANHTEWKF